MKTNVYCSFRECYVAKTTLHVPIACAFLMLEMRPLQRTMDAVFCCSKIDHFFFVPLNIFFERLLHILFYALANKGLPDQNAHLYLHRKDSAQSNCVIASNGYSKNTSHHLPMTFWLLPRFGGLTAQQNIKNEQADNKADDEAAACCFLSRRAAFLYPFHSFFFLMVNKHIPCLYKKCLKHCERVPAGCAIELCLLTDHFFYSFCSSDVHWVHWLHFTPSVDCQPRHDHMWRSSLYDGRMLHRQWGFVSFILSLFSLLFMRCCCCSFFLCWRYAALLDALI